MTLDVRPQRTHPDRVRFLGRETTTKEDFMIQSRRLSTLLVSLVLGAAFGAANAFAQCTTPFASQPSPPSGDEIYIDDSIPSGATVGSGTLTWDTSQYATGSQSFVLQGSGTQTVEIDNLSQFYKFGTGKAVLYVLID